MTDHESYIMRCFQLALKADSAIKNNPPVGAVIVYNNRVIGEGYHQRQGSHHAEVNAIESIRQEDKHLLKKSTLYVSLEPCCHYGKTPPCSKKIVELSIPKVIISCLDPTPKVAGKGVAYLKKHGVEVHINVLKEKGIEIIKKFKIQQFEKRPFITLKWARSSDNYISRYNEQTKITQKITQVHAHKLRSENDAILIATNTALIDNPSLSNRHYYGNNPIRIVLDLQARLPNHLKLFTDKSIPTWVLVLRDNAYKYHEMEHIKCIGIQKNETLNSICKALYHEGINRLLIEGGSSILKSFISEKLWDEAYVYTAPILLKDGVQAPDIEAYFIRSWKSDKDHILHMRRNEVKKR